MLVTEFSKAIILAIRDFVEYVDGDDQFVSLLGQRFFIDLQNIEDDLVIFNHTIETFK